MTVNHNLTITATDNTAGVLRGVNSALQGLNSAAAAIGVTLGATLGALAAFTVNAGKSANELTRMARVANTGLKDFQALSLAAKSFGVEQDKVSDILKDTNDRVGEFLQTGGGEMKDFFEKIAPKVGVTAEQFRNLSGSQALGLYADTLAKAGVNQQEMTFYMESMADEATLLAPLFANGGAALKAMTDEYDRLNILLTNTEVETLNEMNNRLTLVGDSMSGIASKYAAELAPAITAMANGFLSMLETGSTFRAMLDGLMNNLGRIATYALTAATIFGGQWLVTMGLAAAATFSLSGALTFLRGALLRTGIGIAVVAAGELVYQIVNLSSKVGGFGNAMAMLGDVAVEVWDRIKRGAFLMGEALFGVAMSISAEFANVWVSVLEGFSSLLNKIQGGINNIKSAMNEVFTFSVDTPFGNMSMDGLGIEPSTFADTYASGVSVLRAETDRLADSAKVYNESIRNSASDLVAPLNSVKALKDAVAQTSTEAQNVANNAAPAMGSALEEAASGGAAAVNEANDALKQMQEEIASVSRGFAEDIVRGIRAGEGALAGFKNFFNRILDEIAIAIIQKNITGPLVGAIANATNFGGGSSGGGFFSSIGTNIGNAIGSWFGGFFADGGYLPSGKMGIVGEAGPELVKGPANIFSNQDTMGMMGGNGGGAPVTVNFNINAVDTQTGTEFIVKNKGVIVGVINSALNKRGQTSLTR